MAIDDVLDGLDPYDLMAAEAARIERFGASLSDEAWREPSACAGWSRHDLLAHLVADERYFHAGLAGTVADLFVELAAQGATDLHSFNALGVAEFGRIPTAELLARWAADDAETRAGMRARDGGDVDTSIGAYPARLQAFHLASELATHADDLGVPEAADEAAERRAWRTRFSCFALAETKPGTAAALDGDAVAVTFPDGRTGRYDHATFVAAVAGRLPADAGLDADERAALSTMP